MEDGAPLKSDKQESGWARVARKRLPILAWGARYDRLTAVADLVAGVTLGLTLVPQSIAYASLANLPVQYGLYSAYIGTMLYVVMGSVKEVSIGPTSLMALLTLQLCRGLPLEFMLLLTFLSGCIVLLMGLLRLEGEGPAGVPEACRAAQGSVAAVHRAECARGAVRLHGRLPAAPARPAAGVQALRSRGVGPAARLAAPVQRGDGQLDGGVPGHGRAARARPHHDARRHGRRQHRHRQGFLDGRARGRDAGDADARAVQYRGLVRARNAHVRRLHTLRRVALQRRAHAGRRPLLRYYNAAGAGVPHQVLLLHPQGVPLLRAHLRRRVHALRDGSLQIDVGIVRRLWRRDRVELCVVVVTFATAVSRTVELAVLAGVLGSLAALLRRVMRPTLVARVAAGHPVLSPALPLCYLNAELVARRAAAALATHSLLLLDCSRISLVDYSAAKVLERLVKKAKEEQQTLVLFGAPAGILPALESVRGLDARSLRAATPAAALLAVHYKTEDEAKALLDKEDKEGQV